LWRCFAATKSWHAIFFNEDIFPLSSFPHVSMAIHIQTGHVMVALFRLTTFESPGVDWNRHRVLEELHFGEFTKTWVRKWEGVPAAAGLETTMACGSDDGPWCCTAKAVTAISQWWDAKVAPKLAAEAGSQNSQGNGSANTISIPDQQQAEPLGFGMMDVDFTDDAWMRDFLGGGFELFKEPYF
jgi:hypothetical protein